MPFRIARSFVSSAPSPFGPMFINKLPLRDAALANLEELAQLFEQRRQRRQDGVVMLQLLQQVFLATESLTQAEVIAQICIASRGSSCTSAASSACTRLHARSMYQDLLAASCERFTGSAFRCARTS